MCRLLLALENELGIIAPRVVALLEQALAHERIKGNSSDELLKDLKNINFLDMVKEKLKGLLVADLLPHSRIVPVKKAIRNIAEILHEASKLTPSTSAASSAPITKIVQPDPAELAKLEIAKVLAQTLLDQGKTNVSSEELAEIVDEFMRSQMGAMDESKDMQINDEPQPSTSSSTYNFTPSVPPMISEPRDEPKADNTSSEN